MRTLNISRRFCASAVLHAFIWASTLAGAYASGSANSTMSESARLQPVVADETSHLDQVTVADPPVTEFNADDDHAKHIIGATAIIVEPQSQLTFLARVDTGAASCSIHCEQWEIADEEEPMEANIGKPIRILVGNHKDEPEWIESEIDRCVVVKTSERKETRYKVPITLRWKNVEKRVVVTLNNRGQMNYPLLLGRNFLERDFLVDIEQKATRVDEVAQAK